MDIKELLIKEAQAQGVDPTLVLGIANRESRFNQKAISPKGAIGVMQLMPGTAKDLGVNPHDVQQNIKGGVKYIKNMLGMFGGDRTKAVAAYNAGPGNVQKYGGIPPFKETQKYVPAVLGYGGQSPQVVSGAQIMPESNLLQTLQAPQLQYQPPQQDLSLLQMLQSRQQKPDLLSKIVGTLSAIGGTGANIISGIKGRGGAPGNAAIEAGTGLLGQGKKLSDADKLMIQNQMGLNKEARDRSFETDKFNINTQVSLSKMGVENENKKELEAIKATNRENLENVRIKSKKELAEIALQNRLAVTRTQFQNKLSDPTHMGRYVDTLRKSFDNIEGVKGIKVASDKLMSSRAVYDEFLKTGKGANFTDQALITNFNKLLDEASVVRESEYARSAEGLALKQRIQAFADRIAKGGVLDDSARQEIIAAQEAMFNAGIQEISPTIATYVNEASIAGINPNRIITLPDHLKERFGIDPRFTEEAAQSPQATQPAQAAKEEAPKQTAALKPGDTEDGYRYLGGDKSNPKNWKKVE